MTNAQLQPVTANNMPLAVPGNDLDAYIQAVNAVPVLSVEEEKTLAERLYYHDDLEAARSLVLAHLRFVVHIARSYSGYGLALSDLIQEGNVGLMKAVRRFDPTKGVRLVSFAVHWIRAEIHEFVLRNWRIVKVATTKAQRKLFFNLRGAKKKLGRLNPEETDRIAEDLGVSSAQVKEMEGRMGAFDAAFDAPANEDEDNAVPAPSQYLHAEGNDPAEMLADYDFAEQSHQQLGQALEQLDARGRDILQRRWLNEDNKATLQSLADEYGVSAERIRQLENNAIKKLRGAMTAAA